MTGLVQAARLRTTTFYEQNYYKILSVQDETLDKENLDWTIFWHGMKQ